MALKKCKNCIFTTDDESLGICPECGSELESEDVLNDDVIFEENPVDAPNDNNDVQDVITPTLDGDVLLDDTEDEVKANSEKKVKIITASVAFILVLLIGFCSWYIWNGKKYDAPENLSYNELPGEYVSYDRYQYFKLGSEKLEKEIVISDPNEDIMSDSAASSDAVSASDAAYKEPETEKRIFDGTFELGQTPEYVQDVLSSEYITRNNLGEEYNSYLETNNKVVDDRAGFIKEKGISQAELDKIDKEIGFSAGLPEHTLKGLWKYSEETGIMSLYSETGETTIAEFEIFGNSLVFEDVFYKANKNKKGKFDGTYTGGNEEYSETWYFYNDGNCIVKTMHIAEGQEQYNAGTYKSDENCIKITIGGQSQTFAKLNGGVAGLVFTKQK